MRLLAAAFCLVVSAACGGKSSPAGAEEAAPAEDEAPSGAEPEAAERPPPAILGEQGDIPLTTLAGESTRLKDHGARVTVVAMWATWCAPCLDELPYLEALHKKYEGRRDVSVLAVNVDADSLHDKVRSLVDELDLTLPVLLDGEPLLERVAEDGRTGLPLLAIISPDFGIHRETGFAPGIPEDDYLASKADLIEAALEGRQLPASSHPSGGGLPAAGSVIKLQLPAARDQSEEEIQTVVGKLRDVFTRSYPDMTEEKREALLDRVEDALRNGDEEVELQL